MGRSGVRGGDRRWKILLQSHENIRDLYRSDLERNLTPTSRELDDGTLDYKP